MYQEKSELRDGQGGCISHTIDVLFVRQEEFLFKVMLPT